MPEAQPVGISAYFGCGDASISSNSRDSRRVSEDSMYAFNPPAGGAMAKPLTSGADGGDGGRSSPVLKYWIVAISMGIPLGVYQGWNSTLFSCIKGLGFSQIEAAWLGFFMTISGCVGSIGVGAVMDRFAGRLKLVTEVLLLIAVCSFGLFSANAAGYLDIDRDTKVAIAYATGIIGGTALNIAVPLFFELIMELVFGWGDEGAGAMMTVALNTLVQIGFLIVLAQGDGEGSNLWTAWTTCASMGIAFVVLLFFRVDYRRLAVDSGAPLSEAGCWFDRALGCY